MKLGTVDPLGTMSGCHECIWVAAEAGVVVVGSNLQLHDCFLPIDTTSS